MDELIAKKMREQASVNAAVFANGDFAALAQHQFSYFKVWRKGASVYGVTAMHNGVDSDSLWHKHISSRRRYSNDFNIPVPTAIM